MRFVLAIFLLLLTTHTFAQAGQMGVGVMLGNPTGINGKYWLDEERAVDGGLGLSLGPSTNASLHSDFLLHNFSAFYLNETVPLDFYYGIGGRLEFADEIELGVRIPIGLVNQMKEKNADVFAEIAPILDFVGRTGIELHFAAGGRYYF